MIRTAVESDAAALAALSVQLGYPSSPAEILDRLRDIRARGDGQVLVAEIVGLVVDERLRGRGIGVNLVAAAEP